jgi:surfactin synthase thioesterase subunit
MEFPPVAPHSGRMSDKGGGLRLFVFAHAGGSSLSFQDWHGLLPAGWRMRPLDAPGHGPLLDTPALTDGDALVAHFLGLLRAEIADDSTPFAFFGHSMGSLVAYELTRRLVAEGRSAPVWLGVSACGAPDTAHSPGPPPGPRVDDLSDAELRRRLADFGGTPAVVLQDPGLWSVFAPAIRADLALLRDWRPAPARTPLPVALSAFAGADDRTAPPERLAPWAGRTERYLGLRVFDGGHFYFQDDPGELVARVVADVRTALRPGTAAAGSR